MESTYGTVTDLPERNADGYFPLANRAFVSFARRYVHLSGHVTFGEMTLLADAFGIDTEGERCLINSDDPDIIYWPNCSEEWRDTLLSIQTPEGVPEPDSVDVHPVSKAEYRFAGRLYPNLPTPAEATSGLRWQPVAFCAEHRLYSNAKGYVVNTLLLSDLDSDPDPDPVPPTTPVA